MKLLFILLTVLNYAVNMPDCSPESVRAFSSDGRATRISGSVSVVARGNGGRAHLPAANIKIWADGKVVWHSGEIVGGDAPSEFDVPVEGAREIVLETASAGPWHNPFETVVTWKDVKFTCQEGAVLTPVTDDARTAQLGVLTPEESPKPRFNGADIWGVRPGHPIIFRVPVSGKRPMKFSVKGLPKGVTFDAQKGIIGGKAPRKAGSYDITVTAENEAGKAERVIRLEVGDVLALTPPMGWNSWNIWGSMVTAEDVKASALALEKSGLADYGWSYVNIDDYWEMNNSGNDRSLERERKYGAGNIIGPARDKKGNILTNKSFPDMKGLADYIHSFGFKAGLYSGPGETTCGGCEGSLGHEENDARSWADWGFDYVKYDWCSYEKKFRELMKNGADERTERIRPYKLMADCLQKQNRDIVFSYCQYGKGDTQEWARANGANCWRSWEDLKDGWTWLELAIDSRINGEFWKWTGPGCWADPDMLTVGNQRSHGSTHPTVLSHNEQYTHISIWAMICSPLLIGCDVTVLDEFTRGLLANPEVIDISQDRLGSVARRYRHTDSESIWARPLSNGDWAVAVVNRYPLSKDIVLDLSELGLEGEFEVHDVWSSTDEGQISGHVTYNIPPHATKLIRLRRGDCPKCKR